MTTQTQTIYKSITFDNTALGLAANVYSSELQPPSTPAGNNNTTLLLVITITQHTYIGSNSQPCNTLVGFDHQKAQLKVPSSRPPASNNNHQVLVLITVNQSFSTPAGINYVIVLAVNLLNYTSLSSKWSVINCHYNYNYTTANFSKTLSRMHKSIISL